MPSDSINRGDWTVASNWSNGLPLNGDDVTATDENYDNIGSLSLASLTLEGITTGSPRQVPAALAIGYVSLTIGTILAETEYSISAGTSATVTVDAIACTPLGEFHASGSGAALMLPPTASYEDYFVNSSVKYTGTLV